MKKIFLLLCIVLLFSCSDNSTAPDTNSNNLASGTIQIWTSWEKAKGYPVILQVGSTRTGDMVLKDTLNGSLQPNQVLSCDIPQSNKHIITLPKGNYTYNAKAGGYEWELAGFTVNENQCNNLMINSTPNENFRYGADMGKITFWTTWDQVNSNNISIQLQDQNGNQVYNGFLSQYYNFGNKPDCDANIYGATSSKILKAGFYTMSASANQVTWGPATIEITSEGCLLYLLR